MYNALVGNIDEFVPGNDFNSYFERVEQFFEVNSVPAEKKTPLFIALIGAETYKELKKLTSPGSPESKTFSELGTLLKEHFAPKKVLMHERFNFYQRKQEPNESITKYLVVLKQLAGSCEFGEFYKDAVRDQFVCGLTNTFIQTRLINEPDLTLDKAIEIALSMEPPVPIKNIGKEVNIINIEHQEIQLESPQVHTVIITMEPQETERYEQAIDQCKKNVEPKYVCELCNKAFRYLTSIKMHRRSHTGEKPHACKYCGKAFSGSSNLRVHERMHTGEKLYHCNICNKGFSRSSGLILHNRIHTGEKPFKCGVCYKMFVHGNNLKRHNRVHTGERPYECKICKKRFRNTSNLREHEVIHFKDV